MGLIFSSAPQCCFLCVACSPSCHVLCVHLPVTLSVCSVGGLERTTLCAATPTSMSHIWSSFFLPSFSFLTMLFNFFACFLVVLVVCSWHSWMVRTRFMVSESALFGKDRGKPEKIWRPSSELHFILKPDLCTELHHILATRMSLNVHWCVYLSFPIAVSSSFYVWLGFDVNIHYWSDLRSHRVSNNIFYNVLFWDGLGMGWCVIWSLLPSPFASFKSVNHLSCQNVICCSCGIAIYYFSSIFFAAYNPTIPQGIMRESAFISCFACFYDPIIS